MFFRFFLMLIVLGQFFFPMRVGFAEENFLLIDGLTNETILEFGPYIEKRISPCSTFKITLSLIGYDANILIDQFTPTWSFQEGYDDWLVEWRSPQTPMSWMQYSCIWYSKVLSQKLGIEKIKNYLISMGYGNQNISGGLGESGLNNPAWVNSSLEISPKEQVSFIQKMMTGKLSISAHAIDKTKTLLLKENSAEGWSLFGKTGWSGSYIGKDGKISEHGWFVGWVEKENRFFPFAYLIREQKIKLDQRIPRVKKLLEEAKVIDAND